MSTAGILAGLWPALRRFVLRIGRWLIDVAIEEGRRGLAVYLRQRVRVLTRRRKRCRKKGSRYRWLSTRITWWRKAAKWLEGQEAKRLSKRVAKEAKKRAENELDDLEPVWENFGKWTRAERRKARRRARRARRAIA